MQWASQLTPTSTSTGRMNMKDTITKTTDSNFYKHWQNEHKRCYEQDNWLPHLQALNARYNEQDNELQHLQALEEWTWNKQWARQLTSTSTSTDRMNMKDTMRKKNWLTYIKALAERTWKTQWERQLTHISKSTGRKNMKDAMSKTIDSRLLEHWHNEHERRNEQINWLQPLHTMPEWT